MSIPLRPFGRTGVKVSALALGTMMFGARGNPDHDDSVRIIRRALDAGINLVDTADVYSQGESETIVGKSLAGRRDEVGAASLRLTPDVLDEIDKIVPPGVTVSSRDAGYQPPSVTEAARRRRG
nr:aldo/keto reductase [Catenulispora pinisilvae]